MNPHLRNAPRLALAAALGLALAGAAFATEPPPADPHGAPAAHGHTAPPAGDGHGAAADAHAASGEHGAAGAHGGGHAAHCYSCDANGNHVADWMDSGSDIYVLDNLGFHLVNLLMFLGIIGKWGLPAIRASLQSRALAVRHDLAEAARLKDEAEAHHKAVAARLDRLQAEIAEMDARARQEADAEEARLRQRGADAALALTETARRQIRDEGARARQQVRQEAVELAVELAESLLRSNVQASDQRRLAQEILATVEREGVHG